VDKYKNDFSTWVKDVIDDKDLAREISRIKTRYTLVRKKGKMWMRQRSCQKIQEKAIAKSKAEIPQRNPGQSQSLSLREGC
jgi:hypothetical protein